MISLLVRVLSLTIFGAALASCTAAPAGDVAVAVGPTEIPGGDARAAGDITLRNSKLAVAFAVETPPPWGVARGGIIDVATVTDGVISADRASLVDFMPNAWSNWISSYQRVTIERNTPAEAVIKTTRDWKSLQLVTTFALRAGDDKIHIVTEISNPGDEEHTALLSGYALWPDGGFIFGIPGTLGLSEGVVDAGLPAWSAFYDKDWVLGMHAPFADRIDNDSRDRYLLHSLSPGESRRFEAWLQVDAAGELAPLVASEIELHGLPAGRLSGTVTSSDGRAVAAPAIVVEKLRGEAAYYPYAWALGKDGRYSLALPAGQYRIYATAEGHSNSETVLVDMAAGSELTQDFEDLQPPGELVVDVIEADSRQPLDARITIVEGAKPLIGYFGKGTFFTELDPVGHLALGIAPGQYRFKFSAGEDFTALPVFEDVTIAAGQQQHLEASIRRLAAPSAQGWYSADMHHHSDVLDGFTEPQYVLRSELAAGLDFTFLSDHDSVINNQEMLRLAASRGVPFIPATEFSPAWAHFNAYPLDADKEIAIESGQASVQEIFGEARRMGADVVQINHPFIDYGYFHSKETGDIPGGYSDDFDVVEVSSTYSNEKTVPSVWELWNAGQRAYFSAGSDVHDVWADISGAVRVYVNVEGETTVTNFVAALKKGRAYATAGPLVYPAVMFGEEVQHQAGAPLHLDFSVQAVNGLKSVALVERGEVVQTQEFAATRDLSEARFVTSPVADTWYSLVVEDASGKLAYTNPVWIQIQ